MKKPLKKHLAEAGSCEQDEWDENMKEQPYIFAFWFMVNDFQHQYLRFVGSIREGDFQLYIKTLS